MYSTILLISFLICYSSLSPSFYNVFCSFLHFLHLLLPLLSEGGQNSELQLSERWKSKSSELQNSNQNSESRKDQNSDKLH